MHYVAHADLAFASVEHIMRDVNYGWLIRYIHANGASMLTVGVQVDLPESSADSLPEETEPLTLSINAKGEIFIQEAKVEYDNIIAKVLAVSKNRTDTRIYVRGDKTINYGRVLEIMGLLSGSGFTKVALISEPYKQR